MKTNLPAMRPLAVILLPLLVQLAIGAALSSPSTCPEPEDIHPCSCSIYSASHRITCAGGNVTGIREAFRRNKKFFAEQDIYDIRLKGVKAERLPSLLFSGLKMAELTLEDCHLKGLADCDGAPPFVGIQHILQVNIWNSIKGVNELSTLYLEHLVGLEYLTLRDNNIPEIGNDWFRNGPYNLKRLTIYRCGVRTIGDRAFETLTNLKNLELLGNPFQTFHRSILPKPLANLQFLDFRNGNLSNLPEDIFTEMPSLTYVSLEKNPIRRLPEATWSSIWPQLRQIYLAEAPIECDSHIEWIFKFKKPWDMSGWCVSPEELKYKKLADLISENQKSTA